MVPFMLSRLDQSMPQCVTRLERTVTETFRENVYVTPSGIFDYPQLKFCVEVLGADRIIHSVDCPFISNAGAQPFVENAPISEEEKNLIAHGNAERLFDL
jgi:predicted TIM-barrel fold metal-dependent hydrolase